MTTSQVAIINLELFMNKKYFNYLFYHLDKNNNIKIVSFEVKLHLGYPKICLVSLSNESEEVLNNQINLISNLNYTSFKKKIELIVNQQEIDLLLSNLNSKSLDIKTNSINYNQIFKLEFEKSINEDGLIYINESIIDNQRKIITSMIKKIGAQFLKGESIMNVSLPVNIFDERTLLQT